MKINITSADSLEDSIGTYAEDKFEALAKFVKKFEEEGEVQVRLEIKQGKRHQTGDTFVAVADMQLPKKNLHAKAEGASARTVIDEVRDVLRSEIEKYKDKLLPKRGKE